MEPIYSLRHVYIDGDPGAVFRMVDDVERWPAWATHNVTSARRQPDGAYAIETPRGAGTIRMRSSEAGGILDHEFIDPVQGAWRVPARVAPFGDGAVFSMTLAKPPQMSAELFARSMADVDEELRNLKALIEDRSRE